MKILAVDYGLKRVGLASGNTTSKIVFPKGVIFRKSNDQVIDELIEICKTDNYEKIVFGLPINEEGGNKQHQLVLDFVEGFKEKIASIKFLISISMIDESYSTFEASKYLSDFSDKKIRKQIGDKDVMSAKIILERYFDEN